MIEVICGDCREVLKTLADESVQMCVTSPPYWGLRDYGTATWEGGDPGCDHTISRGGSDANHIGREGERVSRWDRDACLKCGARRVDAQLGLEKTPAEYVENLVSVFREVRRVLRKDGTLWLNLGDSYAGGGPHHGDTNLGKSGTNRGSFTGTDRIEIVGLKPKDLVGIPWRVAFALQADGWWLRSDIIWHKPNPMPESVTDRPTKAHEYLFLLAKSASYYYDAEAVKEPATNGERYHGAYDHRPDGLNRRNGRDDADNRTASRNRRSVWTIPTRPYSGAHFATFPPDLVRPCILAGTSERGRCPICGAPWERVVEKGESMWEQRKAGGAPMRAGDIDGGRSLGQVEPSFNGAKLAAWKAEHPDVTSGWRPTCDCPGPDGDHPGSDCADYDEWPTVPCVVLDPFGGAGTVGVVAKRLGRDAVLIDLNSVYVEELARPRIERTPEAML